MNNLYTNHKTIAFSLFLGILLLCNSAYSITINNTPLDECVLYGQTFKIAPDIKNNFAEIEISEGNINVQFDSIQHADDLKERFKKVEPQRDSVFSIRSRKNNISSTTVKRNNVYFGGRENVNIEAKTIADLAECLFESPEVTIKANQINFGDCFFINPNILYIRTDSSESDCKVIRVTFNENPENPTIVTGEIDLKNNKTIRPLVLTNVKEIVIQFASKAWNN